MSVAAVCELALANKVTSWPSWSSSGQPRNDALRPAIEPGGTLSSSGAICAIRMLYSTRDGSAQVLGRSGCSMKPHWKAASVMVPAPSVDGLPVLGRRALATRSSRVTPSTASSAADTLARLGLSSRSPVSKVVMWMAVGIRG